MKKPSRLEKLRRVLLVAAAVWAATVTAAVSVLFVHAWTEHVQHWSASVWASIGAEVITATYVASGALAIAVMAYIAKLSDS